MKPFVFWNGSFIERAQKEVPILIKSVPALNVPMDGDHQRFDELVEAKVAEGLIPVGDLIGPMEDASAAAYAAWAAKMYDAKVIDGIKGLCAKYRVNPVNLDARLSDLAARIPKK